MTKRVAIYARYSSVLQKATSIEDQIAMAKRHCQREGWEVVQIYTDREMSGKNMQRPGFQALKAAASQQAFDVVVVEAIDRLTRKVKDALSTYDLLTFQKIDLFSIQEGPQEFMTVLFAGFGAQMFSQKISDHTKRGIQGSVRRGRIHALCYGYKRIESEEGLNRAIEEEQANVVRRIFSEFAFGKSPHAIALGLNADRMPAPNGGTWDATTIRGNAVRQEGILRNRLYICIASVCKNTHTYHPETGARRIRQTPEETVENDIPELRIIDQSLWDAVQTELARRAAANPRAARAAHRNKYLLSGLLTCGCCSAPYIMSSQTSYRCRESLKRVCKNETPVSRKRIEARVFGALRELFTSAELIERFEAAMIEERKAFDGVAADQELARLNNALKKAEQGQGNILNAIAEGAPFTAFKAKSEALANEITELQKMIAAANAKAAQVKLPQEDASVIFKRALSRTNELLSAPDLVEEASAYLKMLFVGIKLTPHENAQHGIKAELKLAHGVLMPQKAAGSKANVELSVLC